jgi:hypothetical protein
MSQVVQTLHTYQTSGGPAIEARISDPNLGDVKLVVTGRAGEILQAQLIVGDRTSADALTAAAARVHATSDALAGVNVTVRSEASGSWTAGGRNGGSDAEAWMAGNRSGASGSNPGDGRANQGAAGGASSGSASGGGGAPMGLPSEGSRGSRPAASPFDLAHSVDTGRTTPRPPLSSGSSIDIRA